MDPDPIALADFEDIFHSVGGVRAWSGERLTSPLVLSDVFDRNYGHWCRNKSRCDPNNLLQSCYIQGLILFGLWWNFQDSEVMLITCARAATSLGGNVL